MHILYHPYLLLNMDSYLPTNQLENEERKIAALSSKYVTDAVIYIYGLFLWYIYTILYTICKIMFGNICALPSVNAEAIRPKGLSHGHHRFALISSVGGNRCCIPCAIVYTYTVILKQKKNGFKFCCNLKILFESTLCNF